MKKRALFIDRDGTLIVEPPVTFQVDTLEQLAFLPGVIRNLYFIKKNLDFEMVIVSNQDGLGTDSYPCQNFDTVQQKMLQVFENEGITFNNILIDSSFPEDNSPNRKPKTGLLKDYMSGDYDLENSFVIGDRETDMQLAENLGCKGILIDAEGTKARKREGTEALKHEGCGDFNYKIFDSWDKVKDFLFAGERTATVHRITKETDVYVSLNLDGSGQCDISTGIGFFDHLLEQIGKHGGIDLTIKTKGDLEVDEHHTIEDTAIAIGETLYQALGSKRGIERYGFCLPMDDCLCSIALDFGGRAWLVWEADFQREKIGELPTEMLFHFFKSLSDSAKMNLNIKAKGQNEHHKAEGIFKTFAKSIKMAVKRDVYKFDLPSTKGTL
ncbi:MAG: bifunctional histidinol-phosphatase/imidazoleglycerol-phosphate dehydratase HisB [Tannerella sp.]|jgi:imidazoleglycerol-phosphate dehydratase/histidinol-phosphatase|nr:bifunctional histidinol-phosphatase/imidazoleglycerol-phosphate dehydratase HisB [Tannerella sp.]